MAAISFDRALRAVSERLSPGATEHCLRVSETAGGLAETYGVDTEAARLAGLLHDWDREQGGERLLASARDAGLAVSAVDEQVPYLLHPYTGAIDLAEALPGLSEAVLSAVRNHTVGAPDMGDLDKVVFLADMIEPGRDYPDIDDIRSAVGQVSLDELFALGYQRSIANLVRQRRRIHPDTVAVWNALVAGGVR